MNLRHHILGLTVAGLATVGLASAANADAIIKFDDNSQSPQNGTLAYSGSGSLTGSGINYYTIVGTDTPANNNQTLACVSCLLNFTTGSNSFEGANIYTFDGGGSFTITGSAVLGGTTIASGTLLTGTFDSATVLFGLGASLTFSGFGVDQKNPDLVAYYGLTGTSFTFANTEIGARVGTRNTTTGAFNARVTDTDSVNTAVVPEPASLGLFGMGLIGFAAAARRRKRPASQA